MPWYRDVSPLAVLLVSFLHYKYLKIRAALKVIMMIFFSLYSSRVLGAFLQLISLFKYTSSSDALLILCH